MAAVLAAAGTGSRAAVSGGSGLFKQYWLLGGVPLLLLPVTVLQAYRGIGKIVVVVPARDLRMVGELLAEKARGAGRRGSAEITVVAGGDTREQSVERGVRETEGFDYVVIHDAARPFLTPELVGRALAAAYKVGAAVCAVPATDTVKEVREGRVVRTLPREDVWLAQTPQVFRRDVLMEAYREAAAGARRLGAGGDRGAGERATDEAVLVERSGAEVAVVEGSPDNLKVTGPEDWERAQAVFERLRRKGWPT